MEKMDIPSNNQAEPATSNKVTEFIFKSPEKVSVNNSKNQFPIPLPIMLAPKVRTEQQSPKLILPQKILQLGVNAVRNTNARFKANPVGHEDSRYVLEIRLNELHKLDPKYINLKYPIVSKSHICLIIDSLGIGNNIPLRDKIFQKIKDKFRAHNMEYITNIFTITQVQNFYPTPESKKKFRKSFELFLIEGSLNESIFTIMGKVMQS